MELLNTLYNLMGLIFVLGTIVSMGLSLTMKQITGPLWDVRFVVIALLANFVVPPILAFILIRFFSLDEHGPFPGQRYHLIGKHRTKPGKTQRTPQRQS